MTAPAGEVTASAPAPLGGPIYRSGLAAPLAARQARSAASDAARAAPAVPSVHTRPVPPAVAGPFQALTGVDVAGIPVHRGPAVSEQARAYRARAFTRAGEIFLPDEAGPLEHSDTQALLTHELAHAVQQRILSPSLPDETSQHGRELETEARQAEQWYRSGASPPRLAHLPVAALLAGHAGLATGGASAPAGGAGWAPGALPSGPVAVSGVQRLDEGPQQAGAATTSAVQSLPAATAQPAMRQPEPYGVLDLASGTDGGSALPGLSGLLNGTVLASPMPVAPGGTAAAAAAGTRELAELAEHSENLVKLAGKRPADLDDPASLDELATKVYPRLRGMVRAELLVDRERAGLLADPS